MKQQTAILAICISAGIVVASTCFLVRHTAPQESEPGTSVPEDALHVTSSEPGDRSGEAIVVADSRSGPRLTGWLYAVEVGRKPHADAYRLVVEVREQHFDAIRKVVAEHAPAGEGHECYVVLQLVARRACLPATELLDASVDRVRELFGDASGHPELLFSVHEVGSEHATPALLIHRDGRPFGPVAALRQRITLPAEWSGHAVAAGYVPAPVSITGTLAEAILRRSAWATGRVAGAEFGGGKLWFRHAGPDPRGLARPSDPVDLGADSTFAIGPIPAGDKYLLLEAESAWMSSASRRVTLVPGHQDLGVLIADPLYPFHLAIRDETGQPFTGDLFTWIYFNERDVADFLGTRHAVAAGRLILPKYRGDALDLWAWTADGRLASVTAVRAAATSATASLTITLLAPGSVVVQASVAPFDLPSGCSLLVSANTYYRARHALLRTSEDRPEQRLRSCPVPANGVVHLERLWPGRADLALVSPSGAVLAERWIEVPAGGTSSETIEPTSPLAALRVEGPTEGRRFAVISDTAGIVLRGRATPRVQECLVVAGSYRVRGLDPGVGTKNAVFEVGAGEVKTVRVD